MILVGPFDVASLANHNLGLRWRRATQFTITNSKIVGYQKGGFSMESNETAQAYKDGVSKFQNNEVQSYDPLLNFKSSVISGTQPSFSLALVGSPKRVSTSVGR